MGSIFVTGDIHGDPARFSFRNFPEAMSMTRDDVVEILGDFGLVWDKEESSASEKQYLDWLDGRQFTTIATLGNHENYDRIEKLPVETHFGAPVWVIRQHVYLLQSGYVYTVNGKTIWNFNGASSHDVEDGILDPEKDPDWKAMEQRLLRQNRTSFRIRGLDWWPQEVEQNPKIYLRGIEELAKNGNHVDFIFTHCAPTVTEAIMGFQPDDNPLTNGVKLTDYLQKIDDRCEYSQWFYGHYHRNETPSPKHRCVYEQIIQIA